MHGAEFSHQALQFLLDYPALRGRGVDKLKEFKVFYIWEGDRAYFRVNQPPQNLFHSGPVALACHQIFDADGVLGFTRQGHKNPF